MDFPSFVTQYKTYIAQSSREIETQNWIQMDFVSMYMFTCCIGWGWGKGLLERAKERGWNLTFHGLKITCP